MSEYMIWGKPVDKRTYAMHRLRSATEYAEFAFSDGTVNPVCHGIAIFDHLPEALRLLNETGSYDRNVVQGLIGRIKNAVGVRGSEFHQNALEQNLSLYPMVTAGGEQLRLLL